MQQQHRTENEREVAGAGPALLRVADSGAKNGQAGAKQDHPSNVGSKAGQGEGFARGKGQTDSGRGTGQCRVQSESGVA
ncbi:hypothetical protein PAAG_06283 [Paracoccidioides lutzii Pb01]|uniref:Uncharacterized protein n=1 Tax=Paracoccidioides lutzii (strain ATCC MYA-826 / Pb01) TaxID=502779 RepID=C1H5T8_PARBA|nr:hypothetical protein PAAG_06283 [Paracoccidioides lutzii Pb01]EEH35236.2 hypothetical protein PAAG_06283 [Paracoccidioides lutzii Pb01]